MEAHLKIEHLAPYLPYEIQVQHFDNGFLFIQTMVANISKSKMGDIINIDSVDGVKFKPILRTIDSLTDDEMEEFYQDREELKNELFNEEISIGAFNLLLKKKVDVFELIPKGLAIDINTLNK